MGKSMRQVSIPKKKLKDAKNQDTKISVLPDTLKHCKAPEPMMGDGLSYDEKVRAIKRLESIGKSSDSNGAKCKMITLPDDGLLMMRYGWKCQSGFYPEDPKKLNQDCFLIDENISENSAIFGVFDGHGSMGTEASTFTAKGVGNFVYDTEIFQEDRADSLTQILLKVNQNMHNMKNQKGGFDDSLSGTTAICAFIEDDILTVANVGDSRAVLAEMQPDGTLKAQPLSIDQTPFREDERKRCRKEGAVIMTMDQLEGYKSYDPDESDYGGESDDDGDPPRLWKQGRGYPGVAFTRSVGDEVAETIGCTAEAEVTQRKLLATDKFIVIASDGVWEFLSSQTVVDMVSKFDCPFEAAKALVEEAYKLWLYFEVRTDDITAIVVFLDKEGHDEPVPLQRMESKVRLHDYGEMNDMIRPARNEMSRSKRMLIRPDGIGEEFDEESDAEVVLDSNEELSEEEKAEVREAVSTNFLFQYISPAQLEVVLKRFTRINVEPGQVIIKQGEPGDKFYVGGSGTYDCFIEREGEEDPVKVLTYEASSGKSKPSFGELALMHSQPRAATVSATTTGHVWALDRKTFRRILVKRPKRELIRTLRSVKIFESLTKSQLDRLAEIIAEVKFKDNEIIIREGDMGDSLYILKNGEVLLTKREETGDESADQEFDPLQARAITTLGAGAYFGERALISDVPRTASVISVNNTTCLYISRKAFEEVLGPLSDIIDRHSEKREHIVLSKKQSEVELQRAGLDSKFSIFDDSCQVRAVVSSHDPVSIRMVETVGKNTASFTLVSVNRKMVEEAKAESRYVNQRELLYLAGLQNESKKTIFCQKLLKSFVGVSSIHMVFKGVCTGTLEEFMHDNALSVEDSVFVATNVAHLMQSLHAQNIMCRSINPMSLMVDDQGYITIVDLHMSKYMDDADSRTYTICGESTYLAPEQVLNLGSSFAVDFWAFGVLIFELLNGSTPFSTTSKVYQEISCFSPDKYEFPESFDSQFVDLLKQLLHPTANLRLCDSFALLDHPVFSKVDKTGIAEKKMVSPLALIAKTRLEGKKVSTSSESESFDTKMSEIPNGKWYTDFQ